MNGTTILITGGTRAFGKTEVTRCKAAAILCRSEPRSRTPLKRTPAQTTNQPSSLYGRQHITEADIEAVIEVLRSDQLTQHPMVPRFEEALADYCGACNDPVISCSGVILRETHQ